MRKTLLLSLMMFAFFCSVISVSGQQRSRRKPTVSNKPTLLPGREYDARLFLTETQKITFKRLYPEFDEPKAEKNWEWKDVDPLGLLSPEENRKRRRQLFLYEYSSLAMNESESEVSTEQLAFRTILRSQLQDPVILMSNKTVKVSVPYTESYDRDLPVRNLLEKVAQLGLQWAQVSGTNLYIYNGTILMAKYKSGYVSLADLNIDRPAVKIKRL